MKSTIGGIIGGLLVGAAVAWSVLTINSLRERVEKVEGIAAGHTGTITQIVNAINPILAERRQSVPRVTPPKPKQETAKVPAEDES